MSGRIYLDWNATTPLRPQARTALEAMLGTFGNPSSIHAEGRRARGMLESAREQVAQLVGATARNVTFTSGGTEANALALSPAWGGDAPLGRLLVSAIEHPSVLSGGEFSPAQIAVIGVNGDGVLDLCALDGLLSGCAAGKVRPLVSVMFANNETGVIQPLAEIAERVHTAGGLLHVDAVQAPGRADCRIADLGADLLTLSSHKLGGPLGVGALVRSSDRLYREGFIRGGGQERGLRCGTENLLGIVGFGAAAAAVTASGPSEWERMRLLRDQLESGLCAIAPDIVVFGRNGPRLPNTTLFAMPGARAETLVIGLDLAGLAVSSGSACSSGKVGGSHVLSAMGVPGSLASGAIRMSLGWMTNERDVMGALEAWKLQSSALSERLKVAQSEAHRGRVHR